MKTQTTREMVQILRTESLLIDDISDISSFEI